MKKTIKTLHLLLCTALLLASCVKEEQGTRLQPGDRLPEFKTYTLTGRNVSSADLAGKPSVIILFSTTCPDCHRQLPEVEAAYAKAGRDATFLAIARDEPAETVEAFWKKSGYSMPAAAPGNRTIYDLFDRGSKTGVPQVYISDGQGVIIRTADDSAVLPSYEILNSLYGYD
jgi:peroxiredoxin